MQSPPPNSFGWCNRVLFRLLSIPKEGPEISDRIVAVDTNTLARQPVRKREVAGEFRSPNNRTAATIVEKLPAGNDGNLDPDATDRRLVTVQCDMQRSSDAF